MEQKSKIYSTFPIILGGGVTSCKAFYLDSVFLFMRRLVLGLLFCASFFLSLRGGVSRRGNLFVFLWVASLTFAITVAYALPAYAQSAGDACSPTKFSSPIWVGAAAGGAGQLLVCDGSNWVLTIEYDNDGNVGIGQATPAAPLHVGGETIIGSTGLSCAAGTAGGMRYSSGCIQYCDGSSWACIATTAGCDDAPASFNFTDQTGVSTNTLTSSNILLITGTDSGCSPVVSVSSGDSPEFRVCSDSSCSSVVQTWTATNTAVDMNGNYLQLRDTSSSSGSTTINVTASVGGVSNTWSLSTASAGSCGASPTIGATCSDGSVYAGQSPDGYVDMYIPRCDIGMSWDSSNCTGTRSDLPWNNGNNSDYTTTGYTSGTDGDINTAGIITLDSDSGTAGTQPHQAAQACADLNVHGHTDWYLPARDELDVVYENLQDGIPNDDNADPIISGFATDYYWSSSEYNGGNAYRERFSDGSQGNSYKYYTYAVRCARRD